MKKLFTLIVILAFVAVSCCKFHKPKKSTDPKEDPQEQQDTTQQKEPEPDPEPYPEPEANTVEYPFTIKTLSDNTYVIFSYADWDEDDEYNDWTISIDGGKTWTAPDEWTLEDDNNISKFLVPKAGTKVLVKGNQGETKGCSIIFSHDCQVFGNVMSLIYWDDFSSRTELTIDFAFQYLFHENYHLVNHPTLDILLPAITITEGAYSYMFDGCSKLERAPELPAVNVPDLCYDTMFGSCESLIKTPTVLPAENVASHAYLSMFFACSSIKEGPEIMAKTTGINSMGYMFYDCISLEKAPVLRMSVVSNTCFGHMFSGCYNLKYIKCLATDISATNCTMGWTYGVASTGTFVKAKGMNKWTTGKDGIPAGWTVVEEE